MPENTVYRTRIVHNDFGSESAINYFTTPKAAKHYLEKYVAIRYGADAGDWREERSADEKWSMRCDYLDGRAVVMGCTVHEHASEPIERVEEYQEKLSKL